MRNGVYGEPSRYFSRIYRAERLRQIDIMAFSLSFLNLPQVYEHLLDEDDKPTVRGRVVVTDLMSTYLHRYDIGDYAEIGECSCGRGLQTIKKILGRERNMVTLPDGSKYWPKIGSLEYRKIAPIKRFQVVQTDISTLELKMIIDNPLTESQKNSLTQLIQDSIGYPFEIKFSYVDHFPSGKFEEFVSHVTTGQRLASSYDVGK